MMPPFGMHPLGHMPPQTQQSMPQPAMDPDSIQRQIDLLHAQLAVLQASAAQFGTPHQGQSTTTAAAAQPQTGVPAATAAPAAPTNAPAAPVSAQPAAVAASSEDLEDKRPIPSTEQQEPVASPALPVESTIPPAPQTDAERRREELRQRYSRIYGSSSSSSVADNEEKKSD